MYIISVKRRTSDGRFVLTFCDGDEPTLQQNIAFFEALTIMDVPATRLSDGVAVVIAEFPTITAIAQAALALEPRAQTIEVGMWVACRPIPRPFHTNITASGPSGRWETSSSAHATIIQIETALRQSPHCKYMVRSGEDVQFTLHEDTGVEPLGQLSSIASALALS